jgi:hypothetical protein
MNSVLIKTHVLLLEFMMESDNCKTGLEGTTAVNILKAVGLRKKQRSSKTVTGYVRGMRTRLGLFSL